MAFLRYIIVYKLNYLNGHPYILCEGADDIFRLQLFCIESVAKLLTENKKWVILFEIHTSPVKDYEFQPNPPV